MADEKIIIGVAGRLASGKGTVGKYLVGKFDADRFRSSDPLRAALDIFGIPQSRDNLGALSSFVRNTYGEDVIAKSVARMIGQSAKDIVVFDGMRRLIDEKTFRGLPRFFLLFMDTSVRIRYDRYVRRNENPGDAAMSYDDFLQRDLLEPEREIDLLKVKADYVISNNGTVDELDSEIRKIISYILTNAKTS